MKKLNGEWNLQPAKLNDIQVKGVSDLLTDSEGNIWIASYDGVYIIDVEANVTHIVPNSLNPNSISYQSATSLLEAKDGSVWVGTYFGGINIYRKSNNQFRSYIPGMLFPNLRHNSIRGIEKAPDGKIWVGTQGSGIVIMDPATNSFEQFNIEQLKNVNVHSLQTDSFNRMWIGTYLQGLMMYDFESKKLSQIQLWPGSGVDVYTMCIDKQNNLYIGCMSKGLKVFQLNAKGYKELNWFQHLQTTGKYIYYLEPLKNGKIAIASELGIQIFSPAGKSISPVLFENIMEEKLVVNCILEDSENNLLFGTNGRGIIIQDTTGNTIKIDTETGLINNTIYGLVEDASGNIWASTNQGISRISGNLESIKNFDVNDGLISNQFSINASYKLNNNRIYFGSVNGLSVFNPAEIKDDLIQLTPHISEIKVLNKDVLLLEEEVKVKFRNQQFDSMVLKYMQRSFTINFLAYYYGGMKNLKYRYRLLNFNDEWRESNLRTADYTNINPGKYVFEVEVFNPDGTWSEPAKLNIEILQVWYFSKLAFVIYALLLALIIFISIKLMRYRIYMKNEVRMSKLELEKTEEINQMKLKFFTNISHEFRTPLTLINGPIENLLISEKNRDKKLMLEIANRNSNRLLRLINNILDFRKAEQGTLKLNISRTDLGTFIMNETHGFRELAEKKKIDLSVEIEKSVGAFWFDTEKMETVLFNLLSNAFNHTKTNGKISIHVFPERNGVSIKVSDSGIGIPAEHLEKIFDRFYQVEQSHSTGIKGSGIGLSLVKEIIEKHGGNISIESTENVGTSVKMFIPGEIGEPEIETDTFYRIPADVGEVFDQENLPETTGFHNGPSILIIDDNKDLLAFLTYSLQNEFKIILAENGQQGLERLEKHNPDIIISDVMMPLMDGIEFCQSVKNDIDTSHIPLLMLSAKSTIPEQIEGLSTGADVYVTKPFSIEYLRLQINNILHLVKQRHDEIGSAKLPQKEKLYLTKRDQEFLDKLNVLIEENMDNNGLSNTFIAEKLFVSTSTLYRKTTALTGKGINEYIRFKKLVKSKELIETGEYSISEIAYMTGFNTPSYFSQSFKKEFGILPTEVVYK